MPPSKAWQNMGPAIQCCMKDVIGAIAAHLLHGEEAGSGLHDADYIYISISIYRFFDMSKCKHPL
jgi:hypothetical protein